MAFAGGPKVALADYKAGQSDRRSGRARQGEPGRARRISGEGGRLHGLPHRAGRQGICRRPRLQAAVRHAVFDQHHARQGNRHRQLQRPGFPQRGASRHPPRRRAALSGDAVHVLHLHDRRRRAGDQGLSVQPAAGARDGARQHAGVSVQPALGDDASGRRCSIRTRASSPTPRRAPEWNRGAYLAEALAHCGECHTPRNLGVRARQPQEIRRRA